MQNNVTLIRKIDTALSSHRALKRRVDGIISIIELAHGLGDFVRSALTKMTLVTQYTEAKNILNYMNTQPKGKGILMQKLLANLSNIEKLRLIKSVEFNAGIDFAKLPGLTSKN